MRTGTAALALALVALAGPVQAKEVSTAEVCGADGCRETGDHAVLVALPPGGPPAAIPPERVGWYRVKLTMDAGDEEHVFPLVVVPSLGLMRAQGGSPGGPSWMELSPDATRAYRDLTGGMRPFPASKLVLGKAPTAQVSEVVEPPATPEVGGDAPWVWIAAGSLAAGLLVGIAARRRRRRRANGIGEPRPADA